MIVIIDSNCLSASISKKSPYRWLFDALRNREFEFGITTDILAEYEEHLQSYFNINLAHNVTEGLLNSQNAILVTPTYFWNLIEADQDDNKFVDCAVACQADYIITFDHHFDILKKIPFPRISPITPKEFFAILYQQ
ncbi:putative toxin-antitoxin system toxin component, PIN family [Larkinella terrae]|uniref:Putative toxin-antitoxin system toxin component, PIN family n=1 Tax=Larkinella terrae TaxID=2025311 RepID=A0A7K0ENB4_9BACT|nr:putative toxin-antitoxin system toxin component, PIN family [Larkinella terrae]MRS63285.1 putative toxin-antitoxin system toxin component, PIN family [Larkinella terrae]